MVCVPCFIIPAVLFIWYRFLQPFFLKLYNPFGKVEEKKAAPPTDAVDNPGTGGDKQKEEDVKDASTPEEKKSCPASGASSGGKCPVSFFSSGGDTNKLEKVD